MTYFYDSDKEEPENDKLMEDTPRYFNYPGDPPDYSGISMKDDPKSPMTVAETIAHVEVLNETAMEVAGVLRDSLDFIQDEGERAELRLYFFQQLRYHLGNN